MSNADTCIQEMPLQTTPHDEVVLDVRLEAPEISTTPACVCLHSSRRDLMRASKA